MTNYREVCLEINCKKVTKMPKKGIEAQFINYHRQLRILYIFNVDIETNLKEVEKINSDYPDKSCTDKY